MTDTVTLFLALLAVLAEVAVVAAVVIAVGGGRRGRAWLRETFGQEAWALGLAVAAVSTAGSLWFSYGAHFLPCTLCWYQRICMYPLVVIFGVGLARRETSMRICGGILAGAGLAIASYHMLLEHFPSLESSVCERTNPCTLIWVNRFGYLTIPTMAASAFVLILCCVFVAARPKGVAS